MVDYSWNEQDIQSLRVLYESNGWVNYLKDWPKTVAGINHSTVLYAHEDHKIIGLIRGVSDGNTILYIQDLLILPTYQHQGIGSQLLQLFLEHFAEVDQIILTAENSQQALTFYEKQGLVKMAKEYGQAFVMDKRLA